MNRQAVLLLVALVWLCSCGADEPPLDAQRASEIIRSRMFARQPAYAEVPMQVRFGPGYEKDEFDDRSIATLEKLESAGLVRLSTTSEDELTVIIAETTPEGFRELGTVPSSRGPALRGRIAEKVLDEIVNFERHPSDPQLGRAEVIWHYENPTELYSLFDTKQDKPIAVPFKSVVSLSRTDRGWVVKTLVPKLRVE
ncbi:MAG: hypothetical protein KY432_02990 [Acidobacteria bacterium]|nr:hypothetical protein [Acidobacteriota bacterium]